LILGGFHVEQCFAMDWDELINAVEGPKENRKAKAKPAPIRDAEKRTPLSPQAPSPRFNGVLAERGPELTKQALEAWSQRVAGTPVVDVAFGLGVSIELCKKLIKEVHEAIRDDLKDSLDLNRQLDLERVDGLINTFYKFARAGDTDSAAVVLRALQHRSKLTGIEPLPDPGRSHPVNVLNWINLQLPNIHKLVDSLPMELPPGAPS
jgi:hypothetical protein